MNHDCIALADKNVPRRLLRKARRGAVDRIVLIRGARTAAGQRREPLRDAGRRVTQAGPVENIPAGDLCANPAAASCATGRGRPHRSRGTAGTSGDGLLPLPDIDEVRQPGVFEREPTDDGLPRRPGEEPGRFREWIL